MKIFSGKLLDPKDPGPEKGISPTRSTSIFPMIFGPKISCVAMVLEVATARRTFVWHEVWPALFRAPGVQVRFV